MGPILN